MGISGPNFWASWAIALGFRLAVCPRVRERGLPRAGAKVATPVPFSTKCWGGGGVATARPNPPLADPRE
eukprot:6547338-Pyramimonas_sp.AAC.1